jgi:hypothetical protein
MPGSVMAWRPFVRFGLLARHSPLITFGSKQSRFRRRKLLYRFKSNDLAMILGCRLMRRETAEP